MPERAAVAAWPPAARSLGRVNWVGLWALYWRELRRVLREYRDTLLGPAISSLLFMAVFSIALGTDGSLTGGVPLLQFLGPGLIIFAVCERAFETAAASLLYDKLEGMIADILMAPLSAAERTLAYVCSAASAGLLSGSVVAAAVWLFADLPIRKPTLLIFFALAGALLHALVGILAGLWSARWDHFAAFVSFLVIPLAFLSGTFYSVYQLPDLGRTLVTLNPIFYVIDGFRAGFTGFAEGSPQTGAAILLTLDGALGVVAYRLFRVGYRVKP